ncbi:MAG TPA: acyl-CoA dehydrogenase family protein [Candidatus Binatia bacterium]|jgi:alkylation response protein AidB-like acyl-CoA dehydrogenase|nr:acyl-CoA dehydrogenase family protein [Candidatus Binatia bacterium]
MAEQNVDAFRAELRTWLEATLPDDLRRGNALALPESERVRRLRAWQHQLADARWVGITWPSAYGGRDAGIAEQVAYVEEMARAGAPEVIGNLGLGILGPPLIAYGTDEQKDRFLRRILTAEDLWCFGFSEPGAGSDLASLRTQAVIDGDDFVLTGQKVWTTIAHHADWCMVLCRTDATTKRAKGISCLLVDMKSPGVEVRPLRQITGEADFNEVFFENVRVPRRNLLGGLDEGWQIAISALQNERGILYVVGMQILLKEQRDKLMELARARGAGRDPILRQELARVYLGTEVFRFTCQRTLDKLLRFGSPGPESAIIKMHWTELTQAMPQLGMDILGPEGLLYDTPEPRVSEGLAEQLVQKSYLAARAASIASGTSEIMKGIIAMQFLGLPRG